MLARHREVAASVLRFASAREPSVRGAALALAPALAAFAPERFAASYLPRCVDAVVACLASPAERPAAFGALGATARALADAGVADGLAPALPAAAAAIGDTLAAAAPTPSAALPPRVPAAAPTPSRPQTTGRAPPSAAAALQCMGDLAASLQDAWAPHAAALLPAAAATGLSPALVEALTATADAMPDLAPAVQAALLDLLAGVLAPRRDRGGGSATPPPPTGAAVRLALRTLAATDLGPPTSLLRFVRRAASPLLDDGDAGTRALRPPRARPPRAARPPPPVCPRRAAPRPPPPCAMGKPSWRGC